MAKIIKFYERDKNMMKMGARVGYVTANNFKENGIKPTRMQGYIKDKYFQKSYTKKGEEVYKFTTKGRDFVEKKGWVNKSYSPQSAEHDLGLAKKYSSLTQEQKDSWKTEADHRQNFIDMLDKYRSLGDSRYKELDEMYKNKDITMPDCSFTNDKGEEEVHEVTTKYYTKQDIKSKQSYCSNMGYIYTSQKV